MDYTYFYRQKFASSNDFASHKHYDYFLSTYNESDRVCETFIKVNASKKIWILLPEYHSDIFASNNSENIKIQAYDDYDSIIQLIDKLPLDNNVSICIDITGFITHHMFFLLRYVYETCQIKVVDILYSEPEKYKNAERTMFSESFFDVVQIQGFGGAHSSDTSNDLLIIASGYDDSRITDVANKKAKARKIQLFGFPSLQPDMFQENILRAYKAESAVGSECFKNIDLNLYAPANNPFVTAQTLKEYIEREQRCTPFTNIYISPISSKPHALGIALFYIWEKAWLKPISVLYPMCNKYIKNNSIGISKIWKYTLEFPPHQD